MEGSGDMDAAPLLRPVPGSYGVPFFSAVRDRLDFFYLQGEDRYFESRAAAYGSTVVRVNVPPGPFIARDPRVVALLDAKSFPVLFDVDKVEKRDVFTGTYMPSTSLTGGHRVCSYLDPSEPKHAKLKQMLFSLLASRKDAVVPVFRSNFGALLDAVESKLASDGKADFTGLNDVTSFEFIGEAYFGVRPSSSAALGASGPSKAGKWLIWQICPVFTVGLPMIIEDPLLHTVPLPPFLVSSDYKALYSYFSAAASPVLDAAEGLGLPREEACHNLLFATVFNSYGGLKLLLPGILARVAEAGGKLHERLATEIRGAVASAGGNVTPAALEKMELTKSVVWEFLRLDPPVKFQYGRAKADMRVESHDAAYSIKKGEMLFGYQPCATRDARVFGPTAAEFVGDRFVGEEGRKLLKYVYWSNGRETESPSVGNKQCPGKNLVVLVGRLLLVELFLRYDTFTAEQVGKAAAKVVITGVTKAATSVSHGAA
ncbi:allene oxide synthase 2-like [Oryza brachyantha]|uniref:hydroperoxide dehydratase n=1 Tax=Oryza brachyantha TaxID=4533 RepID=J3NCJ4_ORYBR|nr:allene oxide synthase 2-like [Oryza brachyantha]